MARDKQLVIRLEGEIRDKFKQLCQSHDLEMSSFVYSLICRFVDGSIPIEDLAQSTASGLDSEEIATLKKSLLAEVDAKIEAAIANLNHEMISPLKEVGGVTVTLPKKNRLSPEERAEMEMKIDSGIGLNGRELGDWLDKGKSTVSRNSQNLDDFKKWVKKIDPDHEWYFEVIDGDRLFFRINSQQKEVN